MHEFFETPAELVTAFGQSQTLWRADEAVTFLDAGAGTGVWGKVFRQLFPKCRLLGVEIDRRFKKPAGYDDWLTQDFLVDLPPLAYDIDWVVGNPPFRLTEGFVRQAMRLARGAVFLGRLSLFASRSRVQFWREFPPAELHVIVPRPVFVGKASDPKTDYALFVWQHGRKNSCTIKHLVKDGTGTWT